MVDRLTLDRCSAQTSGQRTLILLVIGAIVAIGIYWISTPQAPEPGPSPSETALPFADELEAALENGLLQYGGKGISAAVIMPGYDPWIGVSGISHADTLITQDSLLSAGSITKNFIAVVVLQLSEEGIIDLDDPLHTWLPDYTYVDNTITIRQLLSHTGGIYNFVRHPDFWDAVFSDLDKIWDIDDVLASYLLEPYFPAGTGWHYSNSGYSLLRMIIQDATGSDISTEIRNRILDPMGLENTFYVLEESLPRSAAHGWFDLDGDGEYDDLSGEPTAAFYSAAGGGIFITAEDLAIWTHALYHDHEVVSAQLLEQMLDFYPVDDPDEPLVAGYGLGVTLFSPDLFNGEEIWGHGGNAIGYAAGSLYLPEYGASIAVLVNTEHGESMPTINDIITIITSGT